MCYLHNNEESINRNAKEDKKWSQVTKGAKVKQSSMLGMKVQQSLNPCNILQSAEEKKNIKEKECLAIVQRNIIKDVRDDNVNLQ